MHTATWLIRSVTIAPKRDWGDQTAAASADSGQGLAILA